MTGVEGRMSEVEGQKTHFRGAKGDSESEREGLGNGADGTNGNQGENARQHGAEYCSVAPGAAEMRPARIRAAKMAALQTAAQSKWRTISEITVENEGAMKPAERRAGIRKLKDVVEAEIQAELKAAKEDVEFKGERSFLWEPVPAICQRLEISAAALSRLMRELTGLSTTQMVDKIRARDVKEKMRANLINFVGKKWRKPGLSQNGTAENFWAELKVFRRQARFSYATWAIELGFANYTRFYRACLLAHGMTPSQIEDEILREFEEWYTLALQLVARVEAKKTWTDENRKHRPPYADGWTAALKARGVWMARMRRELGVDESVVGMAGE